MAQKHTTAAARQRQTSYELERHPFESNTLTQLFLILSKHKASWWKDQDDEAAKDATQSGAAMDASMAAPNASMTSPTKKRDAMESSMYTMTTAPSPTKQESRTAKPVHRGNDPKELLKRRREIAAKLKKTSSASEDHSPLQIPDTIVWENNIPKGWFYFDAKECHVARRKVETKQIQEAFLRDALFENDVVAVVYSVAQGHHKPQGSVNRSLIEDADEGDSLHYRYLTASELPVFLFENRRGKGTSVLQKFVYSLNIQHNDCIQIVWSPSVTQVNRKQNVHDIFDERVDPSERCATFEGRTHLSRNVQCTPRLQQRVQKVCTDLVKHFHETDSKFIVTRLVLHTKITDSSDLVILYCSSARVLSTAASAPVILPSGQSLVVSEPAAGGSQLQKKFRVSLEIATRYSVKSIDESRAGARPDSRNSVVDDVSSRPASTIPPPSTPSVTVGGRSAAHHGFLVRGSPQPRRSASVTGSPSKNSLSSPDLVRQMSIRSSSARRLSLIGVVQDVLRLSDPENNSASDHQRNKAKHLLQAAIKKAGTVAMRAAILQTRPNSELTEHEKMELLYLKVQEADRRRLRRASSHGAAWVASLPHAHLSTFADSSDNIRPKSVTSSSRNVILDGVLKDVIDSTIEDRWLDIAYATQTHFDSISFGPSGNEPYSTVMDGRRSRSDAVIIRWLQMRLSTTDTIRKVGHGVTLSEGATFQFELRPVEPTAGEVVEEPTAPWCIVTALWIPPQVRAAQKLFHEVHEALASPIFAGYVCDINSSLQFEAPQETNPAPRTPKRPPIASDDNKYNTSLMEEENGDDAHSHDGDESVNHQATHGHPDLDSSDEKNETTPRHQERGPTPQQDTLHSPDKTSETYSDDFNTTAASV